jgi:hypothetical protein
MNPKFAYVLNYFRQIYHLSSEIDIGYGTQNKKINIYQTRSRFFESPAPLPVNQIIWKEWKLQRLPFLFSSTDRFPVLEFRDDQAFIRYDILAGAFFFLSGWQEYVYRQQHNTLRFPYQASLQKQLDIAHLPIVNYYFDILKSAIEICYNTHLSVSPWGGRKWALCLTHDIDKCTSGWREDFAYQLKRLRLPSALNILFSRLAGRDTWFNFEDILALEERHSAKSSFYFLARKGKQYARRTAEPPPAKTDFPEAAPAADPASFFSSSPLARLRGYSEVLRNADYNLSDPAIENVLQLLREKGYEVGVHGSFGTHLSAELLKEDIRRFPAPVTGGRFHYLCFDITRTPDILESQGLKYDSSMGFAEEVGFRNGIAFPFPPFNIRENRPAGFLEIPLIIMDTTFRSYKKTPQNDIMPLIHQLMAEAERFSGCLTVLWHNSYFSPYKFAGWRELYRAILQESEKRQALLLSGEQVYECWKPLLGKLTGSAE